MRHSLTRQSPTVRMMRLAKLSKNEKKSYISDLDLNEVTAPKTQQKTQDGPSNQNNNATGSKTNKTIKKSMPPIVIDGKTKEQKNVITDLKAYM